jgi:beta-lactam-binding protein with PASTA domain/tRNA A-37 threonylcarbamoyl transferase component Bud32
MATVGEGAASSGYVHSLDVETAVADPLTGKVLDRRYQVGGRIARGGMSVVYAGVDLRLDRQVAIKVMDQNLARDPMFVDRFTREAKSAAKLAHPNAVAVFDQGADGQVVFLVMELIRGRTLRDLIAERGALPPETAVSLLEPVLAVLAAAHRSGLVHRDVKPENVLLSDDGVVKVADFGLARAVAAASTSTQSGVVFGTAGYLAPEQVEHGRADQRSDVYSAGILLYELFTGVAPYRGDSAVAVAYRHVHEDVPPPSRAVPGLPRALDELVLRATRRDPALRPMDAGVFLAQLGAVREELGLRRVPMPVRTGRPRPISGPPGVALPTGRSGPPPPGAEWLAGPIRRGPPGHRPAAAAAAGPTSPGPAAGPTAAGPAAAGADRPNVTAVLPHFTRAGTAAGPAGTSGLRPPPHPRGRYTGRTEQRAHRRRLIVGLLAVLLLGGMAAGAAWWYGSGKFVTVPPLAGLTRQQAISQAKSAHLKVKFGAAEYSDKVGAGRVVRTDPGAGDVVRRDSTILVLPSRGSAPVRIPDVVGTNQDDAITSIKKAGLAVNISQQFSNDIDEGKVISQQPRGTSVPRGTTINLVVSRGQDLVEVPGVSGQSFDDANRTLQGRGFTVKRRNFLGGVLHRVFRQSPGAGKRVPRGATITLDVF